MVCDDGIAVLGLLDDLVLGRIVGRSGMIVDE